jgi:hypothetical protein
MKSQNFFSYAQARMGATCAHFEFQPKLAAHSLGLHKQAHEQKTTDRQTQFPY